LIEKIDNYIKGKEDVEPAFLMNLEKSLKREGGLSDEERSLIDEKIGAYHEFVKSKLETLK